MLTDSTPDGGELLIMSPNAVLGVKPCLQPKSLCRCRPLSGDKFHLRGLNFSLKRGKMVRSIENYNRFCKQGSYEELSVG
ncbi:hypothetical protein DY000_02062671 [Brassica cretica]|uniref:Uncharacterized protein n=1 Tax=Brassica cretica TaxID=69181 RepID=A0ABQ7B2A3_BRACR|nr:hypothetical protein DY000_02062671 [Brassica cretica]